jgi:hypothetical protein
VRTKFDIYDNITLSEHPISSPDFSEVCCTIFIVLCVYFCLSFDLRLLITTLASSIFLYL